MAIVSSEITEDVAQADGRRHITEQHIDHLGHAHVFRWLANADDDAVQRAMDRVEAVLATLARREMDNNIGKILDERPASDLTFAFSSLADLGAEVRERFRGAVSVEACIIAKFLVDRPNAQLMAAFNITSQQATNLKTRLQAKVDAWEAVKQQMGE